MNPTVAKQYREYRRKGTPAKTAFDWAKMTTSRSLRSLNLEWRGTHHGEQAKFEKDGFELVATVETDECPDFSHLGEFTDTYAPEALDLKKLRDWERGQYRYFVPTSTEQEQFTELRRMGYGKQAARLQAQAYVRDDYKRARDYTAHVVGVTAYKDGIELGSAGLGGCEFDDTKSFEEEAENVIEEHGLVEEAIEEARKALAKLCQCKEASPPA